MAKNKHKSAYRPRKKTIRHPILILLICLIMAFGLLWGLKLVIDYITSPPPTEEPATIEIIPTIRPTDTTSTDGEPAASDDPAKTPLQNEGANPSQSSGLTGSITYAAVSGDKLVIRVLIDQLVGEQGTCSLTLSRSGRKDIAKAVNTMDNPSSSTCQGFDIPLTELAKGTWNIKINISAGGKLGQLEGQVSYD